MDYLGTQILAFIETNPGWAMFVIGLTAFGESFVFLSLLFPGTTILIAAGALISAGILDPISSVIAGIVGAVLGDSVSFWFGQKFGPLLPKIWPFRGHPERLTHGISFFKRYGGSSIFIGRFFGPLRAVVPLAAGMMNMPPHDSTAPMSYPRWSGCQRLCFPVICWLGGWAKKTSRRKSSLSRSLPRR
jgi:membrane protein DedA with SNARE-associated domain